jgi:hypothetical protein
VSAAIDHALASLEEDAPAAPPREVCAALLAELAHAIEVGGFMRFVRAPIDRAAAVPDAHGDTPYGVGVVLLRLFAHAGLELDVRVRDARAVRDPRGWVSGDTIVRVVRVRDSVAIVDVGVIGPGFDYVIDHVGATALLALEQDDPYRTTPREVDDDLLRRGAIWAVYLGLGVLAVDAALRITTHASSTSSSRGAASFQHVGHLGLDELAFLVAVQAIVRGDELPPDLDGEQRDAAFAWHLALTGLADELREALAVPPPQEWEDVERPALGPLARVPIVEGGELAAPVRRVTARHTGAGGAIGGLTSALLAIVTELPMPIAGPLALAAAGYGAYIGSRLKTARCSGCGAGLVDNAVTCTGCGGTLS